MGSETRLGKAIGLITKATEEDKSRNYEEALKLYSHGCECFMYALKHEIHDEKQKQLARERIKTYTDRAEQLVMFLRKKQDRKSKEGDNSDSDSDSDNDLKTLQKHINMTILLESPNVKWDDVAGLEEAKKVLKEAVILPMKCPHLFLGERKPWSTILLFGPPGTGKLFFARAVATEVRKTTFFCVSGSDLVSRYNDPGRVVRELFQSARAKRPSIIFINAIDSLCSSRSDNASALAQKKTSELLIQMQALEAGKGVLLLGATDTPWTIEPTIRQHFEKRIYVPLPELDARKTLFKRRISASPNSLSEEDLCLLAQKTKGYSGHDISLIIRDALMQPVRGLQSATHFKKTSGCSVVESTKSDNDLLTPCSSSDPAAKPMSLFDIPPNKLAEPVISMDDVLCSLANTEPTINEKELKKFDDFMKHFGL